MITILYLFFLNSSSSMLDRLAYFLNSVTNFSIVRKMLILTYNEYLSSLLID